ncbi:uncharacterized protein LOC141898804 isoform X2 [Tubulanus polymorphus]|uniref:uncharacterized protein LOC141898804 isoform X2 n=1 Tax=Tubulanus polymorphus TaxID=672921 RepID=UPI003DA2E03D
MFRRSKASDLLNRASSQLRGERPVQSSQEVQEDELTTYLNSLNKKTGANLQKPTENIAGVSDISDVSMSSEEKKKNESRQAQSTTGANKWLKKKPVNEKPAVKINTPQRAPISKVSALDKAEAFANKFKQQKEQKAKYQFSDSSDMSMNISIDSDIVNEVEGVKPDIKERAKSAPKSDTGKRNLMPVKMPSESTGKPLHSQSSAMKFSSAKLSDEDSAPIGKGSSKFLKKKSDTVPAKKDTAIIGDEKRLQTSVDSPAVPRKQLRFDLSLSSDVSEKIPKEPSVTSTPRKPALKQTFKSSMTDDEIPDAFSSSSSFENSPRKYFDSSKNQLKPVAEESHLSVPDADLSYSSDGSYRVNIMDIESLELAVPVQQTKQKDKKTKGAKQDLGSSAVSNYFSSFGLQSVEDLLGPTISEDEVIPKSPSPKPSKKKPGDKKTKTKHDKPATNDFFSSLGLQTLDDLEPVVKTQKSDDSDSIHTEESEIHSEPDIISDARYKYESDFESEKKSLKSKASSIPEVPSTRSVPYSEDFEETSASEIKTETESDTDTESTIKTAPSRESRGSISDSETDISSQTETTGTTTRSSSSSGTSSSSSSSTTQSSVIEEKTSKKKDKKAATKVASVEVQTTAQTDFQYSWDTRNVGLSVLSTDRGLNYLDPTPIACHVVSPDSMEALTAYSPSVLALNDMLKQQLALTKQFITNQRRMYNSLISSIEPSYKYTTLEDTKEYIRRTQKPRLTFDEALKMVKADMAEGR